MIKAYLISNPQFNILYETFHISLHKILKAKMAYFVDFAKAMVRQNGKKSATSRLNFKMTKT